MTGRHAAVRQSESFLPACLPACCPLFLPSFLPVCILFSGLSDELFMTCRAPAGGHLHHELHHRGELAALPGDSEVVLFLPQEQNWLLLQVTRKGN